MKWIALIIIISIPIIISGCTSYYKGPKSDHFDGKKFFNEPNVSKSLWQVLKWKVTETPKEWPESVEVIPRKVKQERLTEGDLQITFINHASFLIQFGEFNILTDPIYSDRASPVSFAGPKRVRDVGVRFEDLPKIDYVLISHNHYDHFDNETIQMLDKRDAPVFVAGLGNDVLFKNLGVDESRIKTMDWKDDFKVGSKVITFLKCQHWSARGIFDRNKMLWGSFAITSNNKKIYFAGDTGYGEFLKEIGNDFKYFDVSLLPIGAYEPRWFMKQQHMNPEEAVLAHIDLNSKFSIGMHFGTFQLTNEGINDPEIELKAAMIKHNVKNFKVPKFGESFSF